MNSVQDFLHMGGYAAYVWSAYAITFVVLVFSLLAARRDYQLRLRNARRQHALQAERKVAGAISAGENRASGDGAAIEQVTEK